MAQGIKAQPVRLILSRKGFDSGAGGCPSPVFPDGSLLSLPIPDPRSPVRYRDLTWRDRNLGEMVETLTRGRVRRDHRAHLDPDLRRGALRRPRGWRPCLGQVGAAQGHLVRRGVTAGDLFLFFGLFRRVDECLAFVGPRFHAIWGWMQVGEVVGVDAVVRGGARWRWAADHSHLHFGVAPSNTLYVAAPRLRLQGLVRRTPGAGTFGRLGDALVLTARDGAGVTDWALPLGFLPRGREPLSYHGRAQRWSRRGGMARLRAVAKGQEFVIDLDEYPELEEWATGVVNWAAGRPAKAERRREECRSTASTATRGRAR